MLAEPRQIAAGSSSSSSGCDCGSSWARKTPPGASFGRAVLPLQGLALMLWCCQAGLCGWQHYTAAVTLLLLL